MDGNILVKMSPRLKISSYVIERLSKLDTNESIGCLYGVMYDGNLLVVGLSLELFEREKNTYKQLLLHLPTEIELCGVIKFGETLTTETRLKEILQDILPANLILKATKDILSDKLVKTAVKMMTTQRKPSFCISMPLRIDTLAIIHRNTKLLELYTVLVEAACRSLKLLESVLLEQLGQEGIGDGAGLRLPETFHFIPDELGHFVTRIVPKDIPDESMEKERRLLHSQLGLPVDRPMFRRGNAHEWRPARLLRAHAAPAARPGTRAARVRGRCGYYHYLQDGFHDDGWGCAYRSLQTIFSWFRYQGYTTVEVPSHREIQQCLVDIGDKPSSFVGSKQWIGSTEVSFCLETLLGVQSRIIFVNTGAELQSYTPELLHHFQKHGSPIMIGGGVLAHTIVGVELDAEGREARYLVLDPHYAGADEPAAVLARGGCGWKGADFWNKTAHYNLCLPQTRPAV
ncbi:probable Ufm1-specific protease 2 isoform X2 [Cydia pomonella]|uniref:probable Ufm1-specific protease 2 isoform X2 n=1 Tax=Cydia pomonella TaxID=82600 RepID=UPI002ADDE417|nr:probable Ufm1-specific protease 2 isoform X2 [Cydia pomonella]